MLSEYKKILKKFDKKTNVTFIKDGKNTVVKGCIGSGFVELQIPEVIPVTFEVSGRWVDMLNIDAELTVVGRSVLYGPLNFGEVSDLDTIVGFHNIELVRTLEVTDKTRWKKLTALFSPDESRSLPAVFFRDGKLIITDGHRLACVDPKSIANVYGDFSLHASIGNVIYALNGMFNGFVSVYRTVEKTEGAQVKRVKKIRELVGYRLDLGENGEVFIPEKESSGLPYTQVIPRPNERECSITFEHSWLKSTVSIAKLAANKAILDCEGFIAFERFGDIMRGPNFRCNGELPKPVGINWGYVTDYLDFLGKDVEADVYGPLDPICMRADGFIGVIMPMRV